MVSIKRINVKRQQKLSCKNQTIKDKMNLKEIEQTINGNCKSETKDSIRGYIFSDKKTGVCLKRPVVCFDIVKLQFTYLLHMPSPCHGGQTIHLKLV